VVVVVVGAVVVVMVDAVEVVVGGVDVEVVESAVEGGAGSSPELVHATASNPASRARIMRPQVTSSFSLRERGCGPA
jgi:hypothetical protein